MCECCMTCVITASLAQSVERGPFKPVVAGSSPAGGVFLFEIFCTIEKFEVFYDVKRMFPFRVFNF